MLFFFSPQNKFAKPVPTLDPKLKDIDVACTLICRRVEYFLQDVTEQEMVHICWCAAKT